MSNTQMSIKKRQEILTYLEIWEAEELEMLEEAKASFDIQDALAKQLAVRIKTRYGWIKEQIEP